MNPLHQQRILSQEKRRGRDVSSDDSGGHHGVAGADGSAEMTGGADPSAEHHDITD